MRFNRRQFAQLSLAAYAGTRCESLFATPVTEDKLRPNITSGVAAGDVSASVWCCGVAPIDLAACLSKWPPMNSFVAR